LLLNTINRHPSPAQVFYLCPVLTNIIIESLDHPLLSVDMNIICGFHIKKSAFPWGRTVILSWAWF
jgi:hypothetical protein